LIIDHAPLLLLFPADKPLLQGLTATFTRRPGCGSRLMAHDHSFSLESETSRQDMAKINEIGPNTTFSAALEEAKLPSVLRPIYSVMAHDKILIILETGRFPKRPARQRMI
jgi:hypothetical protein